MVNKSNLVERQRHIAQDPQDLSASGGFISVKLLPQSGRPQEDPLTGLKGERLLSLEHLSFTIQPCFIRLMSTSY